MALQIPDPQGRSIASTPLTILTVLVTLIVVGLLLDVFGLGILAVIFAAVLFIDDVIPIWRYRIYTLPYNTLH